MLITDFDNTINMQDWDTYT